MPDIETIAKTLHQMSYWDDARPWETLEERAREDWREQAQRFLDVSANGGRRKHARAA